MTQVFGNGTAKTNIINVKEPYNGEAGAGIAGREPVSEGSDTNLVKNATESLSGALMSLSVSARNGGVL